MCDLSHLLPMEGCRRTYEVPLPIKSIGLLYALRKMLFPRLLARSFYLKT